MISIVRSPGCKVPQVTRDFIMLLVEVSLEFVKHLARMKTLWVQILKHEVYFYLDRSGVTIESSHPLRTSCTRVAHEGNGTIFL